MESNKVDKQTNGQPQPYSKPQLTVFGDVRSLTASGTDNGSESGPNAMVMSMV